MPEHIGEGQGGNNDSPYRYLEPGHIRIVELKPGLPGTPLEAEIHHRPLSKENESLQYEAVSYCWGDLNFARPLRFPRDTTIWITESLHSALQSFRYSNKPRFLWADAICINQADVEERSRQVAIMGDIYSMAQRVLVWLGPGKQHDVETMAFIVLSAPIEARGDRSREDLLKLLAHHLETNTCCNCCHLSLTGRPSVRLSEALAAVAKLLERPYFSRLWVVQEVALAGAVQIYCGSHNASWETFTDIARVPGQLESGEDRNDENLPSTLPRSELRQIWARCNYLNQLRARNRSHHSAKDPFRPTSLCKDLLMMSALECHESLDRIFGVSRVLGLQRFETLQPDYRLPVGELYRRVVEIFLTASVNSSGGRTAIMLSLAGTERAGVTELLRPSWVPHLQYLSERSRAKHTFYDWSLDNRQYGADVMNLVCRISPLDCNELLLKGRYFGKVGIVLDASDCPSKHVQRRTGSKCPAEEGIALVAWYRRCRDFLHASLARPDHNNGSTSFDDMMHEMFTLNHAMHQAASRLSLSEDTLLQWLSSPYLRDSATREELATLMRDLMPYITGCPHDRDRNLCIVESDLGSLPAWVPPQARFGDHVYQLSGAPFPFLLRQEALDSHTLVGDAFVQGVKEPELLGVNMSRLSDLMSDSEIQEASRQAWRISAERAMLQQDSVHSASAAAKLKSEDKMRKYACQHAMQRVRELYRSSEEQLGWIRLT